MDPGAGGEPEPSPSREPSADQAHSQAVAGWVGRAHARLTAAWGRATHDPLAALGQLAVFLLRWVLRIGLPLAGTATMLHLFPYRAEAGGVRFTVGGTILTRSGLSADTTFGDWVFPHVSGLPIGIHISPENVDVVTLAGTASSQGEAYVDSLRAELEGQLGSILLWLGGETLIGILIGLAAAATVNWAIRYLRGAPRRPMEWAHRGRQLIAALVVVAAVAGYGVGTYNRDWAEDSRATGTLSALQLFPGQLSDYYQQQSKFFDVIAALAGIQARLQQHIDERVNPDTAYQIMFISDMHLASNYPLVQQYAASFDVKLIVNTGDEAEFGTGFEMTPTYLDQLRALTATVPMIWLAGNHDSPTTISIMRSIPGVIVLGNKKADGDGGYTVSAQQLRAFGLTIAGVPDPRVYGASGAAGSDDSKVTEPLERKATAQAVAGVPPTAMFDIFATHEPVAADELAKALPGQIRQTNSGHTHAQNKDSDVQSGNHINLVEGSTGAGGLDNIGRKTVPPIEFSIESVAANCQFTKIVRFQLTGPPPTEEDPVPTSGQQVTTTTLQLRPQDIPDDRTCDTQQGITAVKDVR